MAALARPRARQAPHFFARGSLAFGLSGFHGHACTRCARGCSSSSTARLELKQPPIVLANLAHFAALRSQGGWAPEE